MTNKDKARFIDIAVLFEYSCDSLGLHKNFTDTRAGTSRHSESEVSGSGTVINEEGLNSHEVWPRQFSAKV